MRAITSTDGWVRRLRANWFRLHRLIYLIALLGTVHFFLQSKADVTEAVGLDFVHDPAAQARLLRHARPWWDVHRHRLAPPVAERVAAMQDEQRLTFRAGRLISA